MAAITDYMFDTSFIDEVYEYLFGQHQVYAVVIDSNNQPVLPNPRPQQKNTPTTKLFPFAENIGGLLCAAENHEKIKAAEPHITLCLKAVNNLLMREQEIQETSNEMLELSKQLNFLFNLAQKISGVNQIDKFCDIILQTIADGVKADYAFLQLAVDLETSFDLFTCRIDSDAARGITHQKYFQENITEKTIIFSLQMGRLQWWRPLSAMIRLLATWLFSGTRILVSLQPMKRNLSALSTTSYRRHSKPFSSTTVCRNFTSTRSKRWRPQLMPKTNTHMGIPSGSQNSLWP